MENSELLKHSKKWDRTGVFVSALCLVHCLALPLIFASLPAVDSILGNPLFEACLLSLAIGVGSVSFFTSYKQHQMFQPMLLGAVGVGFLIFSLYEDLSHPHEAATNFMDNFNMFTAIGGLCLVAGHFWNIHACHCFCDKSCDHEEHHSH